MESDDSQVPYWEAMAYKQQGHIELLKDIIDRQDKLLTRTVQDSIWSNILSIAVLLTYMVATVFHVH